jgi:uncharacterized protein
MQLTLHIVEDFVKKHMGVDSAHDYHHVDMVRKNALIIAAAVKYENTFLVEVTALMHDIGLKSCKKRSDHGIVGAQMARDFLETYDNVTPADINDICLAIETHCTAQKTDHELSQIIRDADILELLGHRGLLRCMLSKADLQPYNITNPLGETFGHTAADFDKRFALKKGIGPTISDQINFQMSCFDIISLDVSKEIAAPRVAVMKEFLLGLKKEVLG